MKNLFTFVTGLVIGSVVTYVLVKDKFEKITQEEIDSVKEVFGRKVKQEADKQTKKEVEEIRKEYNQYDKLTTNYSTFSDKSDEEAEEELEEKYENRDIEIEQPDVFQVADRPYIIAPEEFGMLSDYDLITLTHYSDDVLTDDCDDLVEDIDDVVGEDYAKHFGEYEEDVVYVRNDRLKVDYEICRDLRKYSDVVWRSPHKI